VPFFTKLIALGVEDDITYEIFAGPSPKDSTGRNDSSSDGTIYTKVITREFSALHRSLIFHKLDEKWKKVDLVIAEHAIRNLVVYKWAFFRRGPILALWGHGKTFTRENTRVEEWIKIQLVKKADWFFGYTQKGVDSVIEHGFDPTRTTVVQNSTDTKELVTLMKSIDNETVEKFKSSMKIEDGPVGVFIGALDLSKRLDFLILAAIEIRKKLDTFQLLIFGNGPELESVLTECEKYPFIKYCGRASLETQAMVSKVAEIILMPGRVGLIAVDSFALGLPIITTDWPLHAPEIEYLSPGRNSIVCEDNIASYASSVLQLLRDKSKLASMRDECFIDAKLYTIETMACNFHEGVLRALEIPRSVRAS
jgi:glycosyltransferase involved in cell wall biosynthesis